jgi:hypothetical protein
MLDEPLFSLEMPDHRCPSIDDDDDDEDDDDNRFIHYDTGVDLTQIK